MKMRNKKHELYYHAMILPGMMLLFIFSIIPMFGIIMAFQKFTPVKGMIGSPFVGLDNFKLLLMYPDVRQVIGNTVIIAIAKIILGIIVPVFFAILLNEIRTIWLKRTIQTVVYLPYFLSWVILAVMFSNIFSYTGMANKIIELSGGEPIMFMINNKWFRTIIITTDIWKGFGYSSVIYIAAMTNIDLNIYEAADIDGANRWQKIIYITLPSITPII